jgi:hypothetical protein
LVRKLYTLHKLNVACDGGREMSSSSADNILCRMFQLLGVVLVFIGALIRQSIGGVPSAPKGLIVLAR